MSLVNELIKGLLPEEEKKQTTAVYAGGFKPPTSGHFEVVQQALKENPEIDEFIIFIGAKERNGISQDESLLIWEIYNNYLPFKVKIEPTSIPPIKAVYDFAKNHPTREVLWVIGAREGNEEDFKDITSRTKSITKYPNLELRTIVTKGGASGTAAREASKISQEKFEKFLPGMLNPEERTEVYNIVADKIQEIQTPAKEKDVNPKELKMGIKVEMEHTDDPAKAKIIALQHLAEDPKYYTKLASLGLEEKNDPSLKKLNEAYIPGKIIIYPNFQGVEVADDIKGTPKIINTTDSIGNEPDKDYKYFTTEKKKYVEDMIKNASGDGWKSFPPILAIPHPMLSGKYLVIDGNHRLGAFIIGNIPQIKAEIIPEDKIVLAVPGSEWDENELPETIPLKNSKGKVNFKDYFSTKLLKVPVNINEAIDSSKFNFSPYIVSLTKHMLDNGMKLEPLPKVQMIHDDYENGENLFGNTAYYNPGNNSVILFTYGRHPKDILRSYAHELVHVHQNMEDRLTSLGANTDVNQDDHLEQIEREAYETGNIMFRSWTDSITGNKLNESLKTLITEKKKKDPFGLKAYALELARGLEEQESKYKVYLDMDGVLADFDKRFKDISGMEPKAFEDKYGKDEFWKLIDEDNKISFWVGIEEMPGAKALVNAVKDYNFELLTSPSAKKQSYLGKILWVRNHKDLFGGKPRINFKRASEKHLVKPDLQKTDILIDDREDTIERWNTAGGTGIVYKNISQVLNDLGKLGL